MPLSLRAPLLVAAAFAVGCTTPVVDDVADANGAMTDGVVVVERTVAGDSAAQTSVSAKFMRLSTPVDPELAERIVGSKVDLPPLGVCRRAAGDGGSKAALGSLGAIELIDVGDVSLRTGGSVTTLAARAFPDVGDLVSGMFYTSRDAASDLPAAATYTLETTGSAQVDRFAIETEAPAAPEDVQVADIPLGDGPVLAAAGPAVVRWRAGEATDKAHADTVIVEVSAASGASIRCAFPDSGQATLPGWVVGSGVLGSLPAAATLGVHRIRERSFVAGGLDAAAVRFDLSVVGKIVVASPTAQLGSVPMGPQAAPYPGPASPGQAPQQP
jgi:hypothetical protein